MATWGKGPLQHVKAFRARKWFAESFEDFVNDFAQKFNERNEIVWGVDSSATSALTYSAAHAPITITAGHARLGGKLHPVAALTNEDMRSSDYKPIFSDGSTVTGTLLTADQVYYISMIITNSDGSSGVKADGAAVVPTMVVALGATGSGWSDADATDFLSAKEVQAALAAAEGVHDATDADGNSTVRWAYICDVKATVNGAGSAISIEFTSNRNNAVQLH
tara:strand:+ start:1022 stop:1684 length:663 start_codon:yes stop_codon:yes gene_type:complete